MNNNIIDSYIAEFYNLNEEEKKDRLNEIDKYINKLDLNKLMGITFKYVFTNIDVTDMLELFKNKILDKLDKLSLIKVIDLYIELFNKTLISEDTLMASKNILSVMSYNISDNNYIESVISKKKISKEEYLEILKKDLDKYVSLIDTYTKTHDYLDNLHDKFLIYIETKLENIENQDKYYLIQNINKRLSDASLKLLKLKDSLEYNNIKNSLIIYESYRKSLLEKNDN